MIMEYMKLIYIVEDHEVIREGVRQYLELSGYKVQTFADLHAAREGFSRIVPDLLIQDVMLPDGDGFAFVKQIRQTCDCPVIFMTARIAESDRILGFELGADDYITKPFSPKELVLRVQALFRRIDTVATSVPVSVTWTAADHVMDFDEQEHKLSVDGQEVVLTAAEWRILAHLIRNAGILVTRAKILEECFDYSFESYERIVDTHIKNIRAKIGPDIAWIETVRGYGYRFIGRKRKESAIE
ncbi:MAG: response regulator transcription factor [Sphaerochaetaceae bacterium]|jgi:DNA-binding response OmpR family regulator